MQIFFLNLTDLNLDEKTFDYCKSFLSNHEKERLEQISQPKIKWNFLCGRFLIKTTLGKILHCAAQDVDLKIMPSGRLEIESPASQLYFNISHSNNIIILAIDKKPIGVDIEYIKNRNILDVAKFFFTTQEFNILKNIDSDEERTKNFYYYWTLKEAFIKCNGEQLFNKSHTLECVIDASKKIINHNFNQEYSLLTFEPEPGYIASIAVKSNNITDVEFLEIQKIINFNSVQIQTKKILLKSYPFS